MTRPVADILAEAERDGWPTSYIAAMANHHLCGARPHVNDSTGDAAPREGGQADARQDAAPWGPGAASASTSIEGTLMGKPTPEELEQLQAAIAASDTPAGLLEVYGLATGQTEGPEDTD